MKLLERSSVGRGILENVLDVVAVIAVEQQLPPNRKAGPCNREKASHSHGKTEEDDGGVLPEE
jgi:hypothetical protein